VRLSDAHVVADFACQTGEAPLWHPDEQALYWVDIPCGRMHRFDPATGRAETVHEHGTIGALTLQADGSLLLLGADGRVDGWREGACENLIETIPEAVGTRFNDAIADRSGRVVAGTMPLADRQSHLLRIDKHCSLTVLDADLGLSNGMAFSLDDRELYHSDTKRATVRRYPYEDSHLGVGKLVVKAAKEEGAPDGLSIDEDGYLWSARWGGSCVIRHSPDGWEVSRIELPTPNVSSVAFGGPDLRDLYITTAGGDDRAKNGPLAGALFRVRVEPEGRPHHRSRLIE
jgi:D-xylono/L-arabinono-1,4-lactonase